MYKGNVYVKELWPYILGQKLLTTEFQPRSIQNPHPTPAPQKVNPIPGELLLNCKESLITFFHEKMGFMI